MKTLNSKIKTTKNISWKDGIDSETEDRLEYLKLSSKEKWDYLMNLILATYPPEQKATFEKRIIEWK